MKSFVIEVWLPFSLAVSLIVCCSILTLEVYDPGAKFSLYQCEAQKPFKTSSKHNKV